MAGHLRTVSMGTPGHCSVHHTRFLTQVTTTVLRTIHCHRTQAPKTVPTGNTTRELHPSLVPDTLPMPWSGTSTAARSNETGQKSGERSVAVGGNVTGAVCTGDNATVTTNGRRRWFWRRRGQ